jgi:hypothetical protein
MDFSGVAAQFSGDVEDLLAQPPASQAMLAVQDPRQPLTNGRRQQRIGPAPPFLIAPGPPLLQLRPDRGRVEIPALQSWRPNVPSHST